MFYYYNAHPHSLIVDDCVKRAITLTTGLPYMDVQRELNRYKKVTGAKTFNSNKNPHRYVTEVLGAPVIKTKEMQISCAKFCEIHPRGRYILNMSGHWSACINGNIVDTWDCSNELLLSAYLITPMPNASLPTNKGGFVIKKISDKDATVTFYDGNGTSRVRHIKAAHIDGYRACLLDMDRHEAIDWNDPMWK